MRSARVDHLVVAASSLADGVAWCEATLGVTPGAGGSHPLMGTHNCLLRIATVDFPRAYLEIIAIEPGVTPARSGPRWFDLDDERLRASLRQTGPRLIHFVASVPELDPALEAWSSRGIDRGEALAASRATARGLLQWRIAVRPDGRRLFDGCLPTLIEWGDTHPAAAMAESGVRLQSLSVRHPQAAQLRGAFDAISLSAPAVVAGAANLSASLHTPRGRVVLESQGT